jgi:hypothetical protein
MKLSNAAKRELSAVYEALPELRLKPYLDRAGGNKYAALDLYNWNAKVSAALFETLSHFEVAFRNRMDFALSERQTYLRRSRDWLDDGNEELTDRARDLIKKARQNAQNAHRGLKITRGHIVAELSLGFWRRLLDARYERRMGGAIIRAFPEFAVPERNRSDMTRLRDTVETIYRVRNRIAHHEPIWTVRVMDTRDACLEVIGASSENLRDWVESNCRLRSTVESNPLWGRARAPSESVRRADTGISTSVVQR